MRRIHRFRNFVVGAVALALCWSAQLESADAQSSAQQSFVTTKEGGFLLDGKPFRVAGVNNHYLTFGSSAEVTRVLDDATAMGANVVRTFLQPVVGSLDGQVPTIWNSKSTADSSNLGTKGIYMMSWDPITNKMVPNDGPDGLQKVDFLIAEAAKRKLKLILAFVDFWAYTGGAQQMNAWYGSSDKYTFFAADPRTRRDYKEWVRHVLSRVNTITGVRYSDDPTIFAWDLANEPDIHPKPLLHDWVSEMSAYVKSLAPKQLVTTGHGNMDQKLSDMDIPSVDFGTWHGYPSYAKMSHSDFDARIREYCAIGRDVGKPVILEEFGVPRSDADQANAYGTWLNTIATSDCGGWVVWRLVSTQDSGLYPQDDYDKFDIHNDGSPAWQALRDAALKLQN
ncbi:cellulase family glycosylhydrolase [Rhizobium ruizarguesonis]|uniref:glycoside hydrolase 5 family protein n=1 Tax=Rhizobium ruizarguesonis TaxID=2081791 RepID=UPI0010301217|nr:cellulase family glycosylhydrolase [Rhizobium ruizarguesonis]TAW68048.1 beta-mannosidase [Rhizobium ruizarguesonis]TAX04040.1 beta-mannosidase [Rhizobium ruizarguesonis]TAX07019.1 beta-mannosidase [Rhizobium ruizarguesonis]